MSSQESPLPITVVVPARNAGEWIEACLQSVRANGPAELIVVDGRSMDETVAVAERFTDAVLSDGGGGVAYARQIGAEAARQPYVAFIDVDIELSKDSLAELLSELSE